jgi:hypothetical protein
MSAAKQERQRGSLQALWHRKVATSVIVALLVAVTTTVLDVIRTVGAPAVFVRINESVTRLAVMVVVTTALIVMALDLLTTRLLHERHRKTRRELMTDHTETRLKHLGDLRSLVEASKRLKKVFTPDWFNEVKEVIVKARGEPSLKLETHTAFIGYLHDALLDPERHNLLKEVDGALDLISETARRALSDKLRMVSRGTDDYVSAVFEALVVQKFVVRGLLVQYEPILASGKPDAQVKLADQDVLIEARATLDSSFPRPNGAYDPKDHGRKLAGKIQEKYQGQLSAAALPVILFLALNMNLRFDDEEIQVAFEMITADAGSAVVSALVLSDDFRARRFKLWLHPGAKKPLSEAAQGELRRVLDL